MVHPHRGILLSNEKEKLSTCAGTWLTLEQMPSEESQHPNIINCIIPFTQYSQKDKAMVVDSMALLPGG